MSTQDILLKAKNDGIKVSGISFDTRTIKKNYIFFAIPGSNDARKPKKEKRETQRQRHVPKIFLIRVTSNAMNHSKEKRMVRQ